MKTVETENNIGENERIAGKTELQQQVEETVNATPVVDIHTHLFSPEFGAMNLFGIDEILTYHYLVAELFRFTPILPEEFWNLSKTAQADLIWRKLFVENTPLSEAARGVITILNALELDARAENLSEIRRFFQTREVSEHFDRILKIAGISDVVMTNDPFHAQEIETWQSGKAIDSRFHAALRLDRLLNEWEIAAEQLENFGYKIDRRLNDQTVAEIRRFLDRWITLMKPLYMAVSLPDDFNYRATDDRNRIIREVVLPTLREHHLPFNLMVGVRRGVNPALRSAGDGVGRADVGALEKMCAENPDVNFLATFLSRENQHELCVAARKFGNLMPFGCWWFLNNPSIIWEITLERLEMLGTSFIAQHSDARVLEHLIYKWGHSRRIIADCLYQGYEQLWNSGYRVSRREIKRDVNKLLLENFRRMVNLPAKGEVETV